MKKSLLMVERVVIESIGKRNHVFEEILNDTGLNGLLLKNILQELVQSNVIVDENNYYVLDKKVLSLLSKKGIAEEVKEVFVSFINHYFESDKNKPQFKFQKISMNHGEEIVFNSILKKMDDFLLGLKNKKSQTKNEKVVFWGFENYSSLVNASLN